MATSDYQYETVYIILMAISYATLIGMWIFGCICARYTRYPLENIMMKVFPYIKKSGNHIVVFGFIIPKSSINYQFVYMTFVVRSILFVVLYNTFLTTSNKYSPHDGLDCIAFYKNDSNFEVTSEEQAESENITEIICTGVKFDIGEGIGHAAAILTLSWIFVSIVLWIKLNWHHEAIICKNNGKSNSKRKFGTCCLLTVYLLQILIFIGNIAIMVVTMISLNKITSQDQILDIGLVVIILASGIVIFPDQKKLKSLADHCREVVEDRQEEALEEIKDRLTSTVQDHQSQVDLLLELAELECKKALGDVYYYGIDSEKKRKDNTISEDEMKTIAQVAYRKITNDGGEESDDQGDSTTGEMPLEQLNTNTNSGGDEPADEHDKLLVNIRKHTSYSQLN